MKRIFLLFVFTSISATAQKAQLFTTADFDLTGKVKTCLVITDYGKEEFSFNEEGILTKLLTRFNDSDYDITYYKFRNGEISEKRVENYRDNVFEKNTSIANIYVKDSTSSGVIITEKIVSYANEFLDQYAYTYNEAGQLVSILRNNNEGLENTVVNYSNLNSEQTITYSLNGEIQKTIRFSELKSKLNTVNKVELTKVFLEGNPVTATEKIFNSNGKLISENSYKYDKHTNSFVSKELKTFTYNQIGMIMNSKSKIGSIEKEKKYIYQYDNGEKGNWIKQIITPDNTYITRKITYYPVEKETIKPMVKKH